MGCNPGYRPQNGLGLCYFRPGFPLERQAWHKTVTFAIPRKRRCCRWNPSKRLAMRQPQESRSFHTMRDGLEGPDEQRRSTFPMLFEAGLANWLAR